MAPPLINLQATALTFGGTPLLESADLSVSMGDRICLVGRNGSGKSTLLKIVAGLVEADAGSRFVQPGATVRYLPQEPDLSAFPNVLAYVESGLGPGDDPFRARHLLEKLGMTGEELPARLSGGETRRAALACVLAPEPDVLLLDEPTNHLDLPAIEWLEEELQSMRSAMVIISHDRRFMENLSRSTVWLDRGRTKRLEQGFAGFEEWRDTVLEQEELDRHKLDRKIAREEDWVRYGVTARRKRNVRRMGELANLRAEYREERRAQGQVRMTASEGETSGMQVVVTENVSKSFGDRSIVSGLTLRVLRKDRLGLVGPNGAGKTTILNILMGNLQPDSGKVQLGTKLLPIIIDQKRAALDPQTSVVETLTGGSGDSVTVNGVARHVMGYLKDFLFTPEQARQPVQALSGGERARLLLARAFATPSNLLVLDEPTNDLDLETLDLLEEQLADYTGTILLVSHDRDFLDRVATSVLMAEGDGRWTEYAGGYTDMINQRGEGVAARKIAAKAIAKAERAASASNGSTSKRKLSFKEKHALETLPGRIAEMNAEIEKLNKVLADPALYTRDPSKFKITMDALAKVQGKLSSAEEDWLTLEMLREELEG